MSTILASSFPSSNNQIEILPYPLYQDAMKERQTLSCVDNSSKSNDDLARKYTHANTINLDNKSVNDTLTTELERYKEQFKFLTEGKNVDLTNRVIVSDSCEQSVENYRLKQILSEQVKKESLMQTVTLLKNDFKKEESRNINREIVLEKKIKLLYNIVFKRDQSKAQQLEPKLYDGNVIQTNCAIVILDSEETLLLADESRSKMLLKQKDLVVLEKKVNTKPIDYDALNQLSKYFATRFVPQFELSTEQVSYPSSDPIPSNRPTIVKVPSKLSKVSMSVKISDLNVSFQEQDLVIIAIKEELRKLKGKDIVENVVTPPTIALVVHKVDLEPLSPKLKNNREAHVEYIRITKENVDTLRAIVEQARTSNPLDNMLAYACMYTKQIQEFQNQRDLPKEIPLDSVEVLRYDKRSKSEIKGKVPTEMELVLEHTQQGTSYEVLADFDKSNTFVLERFDTLAGNLVKEILLKLNLPDHRSILTDLKVTATTYGRMTKPNSSPRFIANCFNARNLKMKVNVPDSNCLKDS
nr:hypothetical protein [Tanacetum cinerariifolium]